MHVGPEEFDDNKPVCGVNRDKHPSTNFSCHPPCMKTDFLQWRLTCIVRSGILEILTCVDNKYRLKMYSTVAKLLYM